jgi:hypothetical protein
MAVKQKQDVTIKAEESVFDRIDAQKEVEITDSELFVEQEPVKEEMVPLSFVEKLMKQMEDKFAHQINKLKTNIGREQIEEELNYVRDLEDDWLEQPVVFFAFSMNFSIHGDKKRGIDTAPPAGAIKFKPLIRTKRKGARGETQVVSVSSVSINSIEVVEYLRGHSQFGIAFYENMESAMNIDSTWAQKLVEAQQSMGRLSDMQIIARAKQEGLSVTQSVDGMRRALVELTAKRTKEQQDKLLYGSIRNSVVDEKGRSVIEKTIA